MNSLWKDLRFGLRTLARQPAPTAVALLALALGIGANTAIFSVVNGVLLEPLPFPESDELVLVWEKNPGIGFPRFTVAPLNYYDWREQARSFEGLALFDQGRFILTGGDQPEVLLGARVTAHFFRVLGVEPALGRGFALEEERFGGPRVAVLGHGFWQSRFGADPEIVGRAVEIDGESYAVVGVAPKAFEFPAESQIWLPFAPDLAEETRGAHYTQVVGRLKPEVSRERAASEMAAIAARLERQYPDTNSGWGTLVVSLHEDLVQDIRPALLMLLVAVAFVLLIACANVANLLLARVAAREREIAIRSALGAGRGRVIRQMLTETMLLFVTGGLLGLLLAWWGTKALIAINPDALPHAQEVGLDGRVLLFTLGVSLATGLLFGLVPALHAGGEHLHEALKEGGRGLAGGVLGRMTRNALVLFEVAIALVLLVVAGLLIHSFSRLQAVDPGFRPAGVLTAQIALPAAKYSEPPRQIAFFRQLLERIEALPGVEVAASILPLPLGDGSFVLAFTAEGRPAPSPSEVPNANIRVVSPGYFRVMGIPLRSGRTFTAEDAENTQPVLIVNQTMAAKVWPGEDPLGKRITFDDPADPEAKWWTVVGVVGDVRHSALEEEPGSEAYWPQFQNPMANATLLVRTSREPESLAGSLRAAVRALDPDLPLDRVRTLADVVYGALSQSRFKTVLLGLFAGLALILAAVGVYGVISYSVTQRTHEIGIRMALGARRGEVLGMVVRQGMMLVAAGVVAGLVLAWFGARLLAGQIYGVSTSDPLTFAVVPLVLLAVALFANYLPARRATEVDPLEALRYE